MSTDGKVSGMTRSLAQFPQTSIARAIVAGRGQPGLSARGPSIDRLRPAYAGRKGRASLESLPLASGHTSPSRGQGPRPTPFPPASANDQLGAGAEVALVEIHTGRRLRTVQRCVREDNELNR